MDNTNNLKMKNLILIIGLCFAISSCDSQEQVSVTQIANDKDFYYSSLYEAHEIKIIAGRSNLNRAIFEKVKELGISKTIEVCNRIEDFKSIDGAVEYLKLDCKSNEYFDKVVAKYGIDFINKNISKISKEFSKKFSIADLKSTALPLNNDY